MKLTPDMLKETGATFTEGEPAINLPLTVKGVVASLLVKQDIDGPVKVSMRTKGDLTWRKSPWTTAAAATKTRPDTNQSFLSTRPTGR